MNAFTKGDQYTEDLDRHRSPMHYSYASKYLGVGGTEPHSYAVGVGIIDFLGCFVTPPTHSDMPINQIMDHWLGSDQICEECVLIHACMHA